MHTQLFTVRQAVDSQVSAFCDFEVELKWEGYVNTRACNLLQIHTQCAQFNSLTFKSYSLTDTMLQIFWDLYKMNYHNDSFFVLLIWIKVGQNLETQVLREQRTECIFFVSKLMSCYVLLKQCYSTRIHVLYSFQSTLCKLYLFLRLLVLLRAEMCTHLVIHTQGTHTYCAFILFPVCYLSIGPIPRKRNPLVLVYTLASTAFQLLEKNCPIFEV